MSLVCDRAIFRSWTLSVVFGVAGFLTAMPSHAINLGGTEVPKEKMIVYLMIGHSNMAGQEYQASDGVTMPRAWNYAWNKDKKWALAKETPGSRANGFSGNGAGGPSMPLLKGMAAAYPEHYFGVISNASLSATLHGENLGNSSSDLENIENRYWKGTILYKELITIAKEVQNDVTFGGVVCMLGSVEATRTTEAVCKAFGADLATLASDIRTDLGLPNLPFIMGGYENGATGSFALTKPMPAIIDEQIKLFPTLSPRTASVDTKGIQMLDDHHYTAKTGQGEFAKRVVTIIQTNNWLPGAGTAVRLAPSAHEKNVSKRKATVSLFPVGPAAGLIRLDGKWLGDRDLSRITAAVLPHTNEALSGNR
jgi:hypothetical protein